MISTANVPLQGFAKRTPHSGAHLSARCYSLLANRRRCSRGIYLSMHARVQNACPLVSNGITCPGISKVPTSQFASDLDRSSTR